MVQNALLELHEGALTAAGRSRVTTIEEVPEAPDAPEVSPTTPAVVTPTPVDVDASEPSAESLPDASVPSEPSSAGDTNKTNGDGDAASGAEAEFSLFDALAAVYKQFFCLGRGEVSCQWLPLSPSRWTTCSRPSFSSFRPFWIAFSAAARRLSAGRVHWRQRAAHGSPDPQVSDGDAGRGDVGH